MESLIRKYEGKLIEQGLCEAGSPVIGGLDADIIWNREAPEIPVLEKIIGSLNINSILFAKPVEPFDSIIHFLARNSRGEDGAIHPHDTESRTFLHDIPVADGFEAGGIITSLRRRKSVIVPGRGIVTFGIVSPEQAFVHYSSVCFASYVKFFTDYYFAVREGDVTEERRDIALMALDSYGDFISSISSDVSGRGPFRSVDDAFGAMCEAGRLTVHSGMVDSFFGNISCKLGDDILISETGSSLDELEGLIDICPLDNSSTAAVTASSELTAHKGVYARTDRLAILHGHPKFSVVISMLCDDLSCENRGRCHITCSRERHAGDVPIIPGEVGTGPTGLSNTLPKALTGRGAIVFGHGLFTTGAVDFTDACKNLIDIERQCFMEFRKRVEL